MKEVHETMLACPNIKTMNLRVTMFGCSERRDRWNFPFRLAGGEVYPNLTSLTLEGYDFNQSDWADASPRSYWPSDLMNWINFYSGLRSWFSLWSDTPKERRHLTNLQLWLEAMDWSKLDSLGLILNMEEYFLELAMSRLTGLKSLEIHGSSRRRKCYNKAMLPVSALPAEVALTNFTWIDGWNPNELATLLDRYRQTLTRLELYSKELRRDPVLNTSQLEAICAKAPHLEHLSLSIDRDGSWPWDVLKGLAKIQSLVSADVWLELAAEHMRGAPERGYWPPGESRQNASEYREPRLNATTATGVFSYLLKHNDSSNLRNVTFYIGDWGRAWDGPLRMLRWLDGQSGKVECSLYSEHGERKKPNEPLCVHTVDMEGGFMWDEGLSLEDIYDGGFVDDANLHHPQKRILLD
jgi:hypothetical protein